MKERLMIASYEQSLAERRLVDAKEQARLYRKAYRMLRAANRVKAAGKILVGGFTVLDEDVALALKCFAKSAQIESRAAMFFELADNV